MLQHHLEPGLLDLDLRVVVLERAELLEDASLYMLIFLPPNIDSRVWRKGFFDSCIRTFVLLAWRAFGGWKNGWVGSSGSGFFLMYFLVMIFKPLQYSFLTLDFSYPKLSSWRTGADT